MTNSSRDGHAVARTTAVRIGRVGVWTSALGGVAAAEARAGVRRIEELGYGAVWIGETPRLAREVFVQAGLLLAATHRCVVGTGIANIWLRQAATAAAAAGTLAEAYDDRFVLGVGASHPVAAAMVGEDYSKPLTAMRVYLQDMVARSYRGPASSRPLPVVVAALRPKMQLLARDAADGVHSFFVTPEHTAAARERLGPGPLLVPEQAVVLDTDVDRSLARARAHVRSRLEFPAYVAHLRVMGFTDEDLGADGSVQLVDRLVARGTGAQVALRVREHLQAGADHVAVHVLTSSGDPVGLDALAVLAAELDITPQRRGEAPTAATEAAP